MYVCMHARYGMYVCMYASMHACIYTHLCMSSACALRSHSWAFQQHHQQDVVNLDDLVDADKVTNMAAFVNVTQFLTHKD